MIEKVNIKQKLGLFDQHWSPKVIAELNGQYLKVVKLKGEFVWHHHENEDELFWVIEGSMKMELRDKTIILEKGELVVIPRMVEHRPVAEDECQIVLFEPKETLNTGNVGHKYTLDPENLDKI